MQLLKKAGPIVVALASYFAVKAFFFDTAAAKDVGPEQLEHSLLQADHGEFFQVLKAGFPQEFHTFIEELTEVVNQEHADKQQKSIAVRTSSAAFTAELRRENAHYLRQTPADLLRALHRSKLDLLLAVQDDPALCNKVAQLSAAALSANEMNDQRQAILFEGSIVVLNSIVAGRDHPVERKQATEEDYADFLAEWRKQSDVTSSMFETLMKDDASSGDYCASMTSFQRYSVAATGRSAERVLAELSVLTEAR